jgi:hypothetical protein
MKTAKTSNLFPNSKKSSPSSSKKTQKSPRIPSSNIICGLSEALYNRNINNFQAKIILYDEF